MSMDNVHPHAPLQNLGNLSADSDPESTLKASHSGIILTAENLQALFAVVPSALLLLTSRGEILQANAAAARLLGVELNDLLKRSLKDFCAETEKIFSISSKERSQPGCLPLKQSINTVHRLDFLLLANVANGQHLLILQPSIAPTSERLMDTAAIAPAVHNAPALADTLQQLHLQSAALNACADVILITDRNGIIEWVNPAFTELTGYPPSEAVGHNPSELVNSGVQDEAFFRQLWQTILAGEVWRGQIVNRRKDHTHYVEEMTITPVYNGDDNISHFIAIKQDITERKRAEERQADLIRRVNTYAHSLEQVNCALTLSEQRYRSIVQTQTDLVCRFTLDGILTFVNDAYCCFFNQSAEDLLGRSFLALVPPENQPEVIAQLVELRQLTTAHAVVMHEHQALLDDGQVAWHQWINQGLFDDAGQLVEIQAIGRDITALKQTETALRDREHQLSLFFAQSLDGFFFMMLDEPVEWHAGVNKDAVLDYVFDHQHITRVNQAILSQYGFTEAEFLGFTPRGFFAHDLEAGRAVWRQLFDQGRLHIETWERKADGTPIWIEGDYICLYDEQGRITGHFGVQRDVTDLRDAIASLRESESNYRLLVENQTDLVVKVDVDGNFLFASPSYCQLFGCTAAALADHNFKDFVHPDDVAATLQTMESLWQPPHTCRLEQRVLTDQGVRWLSWADTAVVDAYGQVTAIVGVGRDITDRKQMERALQQSEQRFRNVLETMTLVAIMLDRHGNIVFCNDYFLTLTGWPREAVMGRNWHELFIPPELRSELRTMLTQTVEQETFPVHYENEILTRSGDRRLISWNNTVQRDANGTVISVTSIGKDITVRTRNENHIRELSQRLSLATRSAKIGVWDLDLATEQLVWDEQMQTIYGLEQTDWPTSYQAWFEQVHPDDVAIIEAERAQLIAGDRETHCEFRIIRPNGDIRYVEAHTVGLRDANGQLQRLIGTNLDVTTCKANERSIRELSERLRLATQSADLGVWEYIISEQRLIWDERMLAIYGITRETFDQHYSSWEACLLPEDLSEAQAQVEAAIAGESEFHVEFRIQRPDGEIRTVEGHGLVKRDAQGQPFSMVGVNVDVTDRRRNAAAIYETSRRLSLATEAAQLGIWEWDVVHERIFWDDLMYELYGISQADFAGTYEAWQTRVHPADWPSLQAQIETALEQDTIFHTEFRILRPDGTVRYLECYAQIVRDAAQRPVRMTGINRDLSDRHHSEAALRETTQRLTLATDAAQLGIWEWDVESDRVLWDQRMYAIYGLAPGDFSGLHTDWLDTIHPDDRAVMQQRGGALQQDSDNFNSEFRIVRPDGEVRHIESSGYRIRNAEGNVVRVVGINRDISDRKRAAIELAETHQQLQALMQNSPAIIELYDEAGRYQQVNSITADFLGRPIADIVGKRFDEVHTPEVAALFMQRVQQLAATNEPMVVEDRLNKGGQERILQSVLFPVLAKPGQPKLLGLIATDITDLVSTQRQLQNRIHREQLLRAVTVTIRRSLDLDTILNSAVEGVRNALQSDRVLIYRFNADWSGDMIVESVDSRWVAVLGETLRDPCFAGRWVEQYRQGHIGQINDIQAEAIAPCHRDLLAHYQVQANLVLPIVVNEALWGLLCIHQCSGPRQWQPDEIYLAQQITDQLEIAVQQAKLLHETAVRAQREELRRRVTQHIRRSLDLDAVLATTTHEIRHFLNCDRVLINRFNPDHTCQVVVESVGHDLPSIVGNTIHLPCFNAAMRERFAQGHIQKIDHIEDPADHDCAYRDGRANDVQAVMTLPIIVENELWGLLCVQQCHASRHWQEDEVVFVQQIIDQVAIAIQQAQLLQQTAARAKREQVLNEIVSYTRDSLNMADMAARTTQKLLEAFEAGRCVLIRCQPDDDYFAYAACASAPGIPDLVGERLPLQDSPYMLEIMAQEEPSATTDILQAQGINSLLPQIEAWQVRAALSVSIRYEGAVKGILCIHHPEPRQWTDSECILLKQIADQLAIALQQAELYQQAQSELAERMRLEEQLRHEAMHDALTGLPNRALFSERLQFALQRYRRHHWAPVHTTDTAAREEFAVLFLDLDRFKVINDSLGHRFGDQLLQLVGDRLTHCLRDVDIAARLGGDEFVVLLEDIQDAQYAVTVARRIHNALELPIFLENREVFVHASIGIAFSGPQYTSPEQVLRDADIAMYQAKKSEQEYVVFDASMHAIALQQMNLENDLRHAIKKQEFKLFYQPIVALATGKITGFEALVRWQHPTRGLLYPNAFVEVAEDTGLIAAIDLWVLQEACRQLHEWHTQSPELADLSMSVNLSGKQFSQPDLIAQIDHALHCAQLDGKHLKLEITESVLITNNDLAIKTLEEFRARHIQICMDDFGTGYSSLSYLHQFPVDLLKIDKSFILNLNSKTANPRDYEIVRAIINLALNLNLQVVAEGIENHDVLVYLQKNRCQFGQGYHFSSAVDRATATQLLLRQPF